MSKSKNGTRLEFMRMRLQPPLVIGLHVVKTLEHVRDVAAALAIGHELGKHADDIVSRKPPRRI